jgi:hypothetical protein
MRSNLQKKVLTVKGKSGTHRQTFYVADKQQPSAKPGHTVPTTVHPRDRVEVHYGMLWSKGANQGIDHALEAIGKTHSIPGNLQVVPIRVKGYLAGANATYGWNARNGEINVSKYAMGPAASTAHEYGHYLDHKLFGKGGSPLTDFATHSGDPKIRAELKSLKLAMYKSKAIHQLVKRHEEHEQYKDYQGQALTQYLLTPTEIFARAYSQWIGTRSSPQIRHELHEADNVWRSYGYHAQWDDKDFEPIARQFDHLFAKRGLRRAR